MAESVHEQLAAAIKTSLAAIVGDAGTTYWYTPGAVARSSWSEDDTPLLDPSVVGPIYAVRPGEERHTEDVGEVVNVLADIHILLVSRFETPEAPLTPATPSRATVVNRMVRDVLRKLLADVQLGAFSVGGLVENIFAEPVIVDRDRFVAGWAIAEIVFASAYRYVGGAP